MSLKAFHIVFIAASVLLAVGFGIWEILRFAESGSPTQLILAVTSFLVAGGLVVYGIKFLRKLKHVGYL